MAKEENSARTRQRNDTVRFTVLDFFIIVLVITVVAGMFFRGYIAKLFTSESVHDKAEIGFVVYGVDKEIAEAVKEDDLLYIGEKHFASVGEAFSEGFTVIGEGDNDKDGVLDFAVDEERSSIRGVLIVDGQYTDKGFRSASEMYLYVGKMLEIKGPGYTLNVIITEIPRK